MKKTINILRKWFELKIGWFFINGNKQDEWSDYLEKKYKDNI